MDWTQITNSELFVWIVIPFLIFLARIIDVSLGTVRFICISRGSRSLSAILGFFEVLIWIIVIGQIMNNLRNPLCYVAYAAGFATGTYIGCSIAEKLSIGLVTIRIFCRSDWDELIEALKAANHGLTVLDGQGSKGPVKIIFTIVQKRNAENVIRTIKRHNPKAFFSIENVGYVEQGVFSNPKLAGDISRLNWLKPFRKGK